MPQFSRKKLLKIPVKPSSTGKMESKKHSSVLFEGKSFNSLKSGIPSFGDLKKPKQPSSLPKKSLDSNVRKIRLVKDASPKSSMNVFLGKLPSKSHDNIMVKLPKGKATFLDKKVSCSSMVTQGFMQKEQDSSEFLSILTAKGRLTRHKIVTSMGERKGKWDSGETQRLPYAKRLQLLQAMLENPLPFLDLHTRFGVSKQTIRRLVKNGLLMETWGRKEIGVRFKLTKKGKLYLKELEAAATCESKMKEKNLIKLKYKTSI